MATCCICFEIYDQEYAKAFTAPCGHSICAQCEFKLRVGCIKKGIPAKCWTCMKPFSGPLYRTYELESKTPRTEQGRFPNPTMSDNEIRWELQYRPELYEDISLPNYTPDSPPRPSPEITVGSRTFRLTVPPHVFTTPPPPRREHGFRITRHHPYRPPTIPRNFTLPMVDVTDCSIPLPGTAEYRGKFF